jgi:hypothetical protein
VVALTGKPEMTRNQPMSSYHAYLETFAVPRLFRLGAAPGGTPILRKSGKILCLDQLTVPLTTGSISASQTTRERDFLCLK